MRPEISADRPEAQTPRRLLAGARLFASARIYTPVSPSCLLDSLSLIRFLSKRGLGAHLVFGVTHSPFSAHCWVQSGHWVLNDTVGNVHSYRPIRTV